MKLGLSTAAYFGRHETEAAAGVLARLPLDCAEVFLQTPSEYSASFARLVKHNLGDLPCTSVHPLGTQFESQMFSSSPRQREDAFGVFGQVLCAMQALDAKIYVHHGRNTPQLRPLPWNLSANVQIIGRMCDEAAQRGITIAWENVFWCQLTTPERVLEAKAALPQARFTLDIKQAMRAGCDPVAFVHAMGGALCNVHVCDWQADGSLCLPGEGVFDFDAFFSALEKVGYQGPVIMEPYLALIKSDEALARSIAFMRNKIKE